MWGADEILTYGYVKARVQWLLNKEVPLTDPSKIARGLGGYTHQVCSCAPSREEAWPSLTPPRLPLGARGPARALRLPIYDRPLAPAPPMMLVKARVQKDKPRVIEARGLPGAAPWARHCRPLFQQGHARAVTQEYKASQQPLGARRPLGLCFNR
jgi:hypothetical protein